MPIGLGISAQCASIAIMVRKSGVQSQLALQQGRKGSIYNRNVCINKIGLIIAPPINSKSFKLQTKQLLVFQDKTV